MKRFVFIIDGIVQCRLSFSDNRPDTEMKVLGLNSNPMIVEITNLTEKPTVGWTYDESGFHPPA